MNTLNSSPLESFQVDRDLHPLDDGLDDHGSLHVRDGDGREEILDYTLLAGAVPDDMTSEETVYALQLADGRAAYFQDMYYSGTLSVFESLEHLVAHLWRERDSSLCLSLLDKLGYLRLHHDAGH